MQLGLVRLMGYLPEDWFEQVPVLVAAFVGQQLGIAPDALASYGERAATRNGHLHLVLRHLGYLLRPAVSVLELLVSQVLLQTNAATYQRLVPLLRPVVEAQLDALLVPDPALRVTPHRWLCQPATANTPAAINQALAKLDFLHQLGLAD